MVEQVDDILDELGPLPAASARADGREIRHPAELKLNEQETKVLQLLDGEPMNVDELIHLAELPVSRVLSILSALEMRSLVERCSGHLVTRR